MKWIGIILGSLAVIVAVVALAGMMLPKAHRATRSAHFRQPPEAVYAVIAGPPDWRSEVKAFGKLSSGQWWEQDAHGRRITFELVEDRAPQGRVTRIADRSLPFGGTWTVEITP